LLFKKSVSKEIDFSFAQNFIQQHFLYNKIFQKNSKNFLISVDYL